MMGDAQGSLFLAVSIVDQVLGLKRLSVWDAGVVIGWRWEVAAWAWVLIAMAAVGLAVWCYRRLPGGRVARAGLGAFRWALVMFVAVLLVGPLLVLPRERVEPDWLLLLIDRSASMAIQDEKPVAAEASDPTRVSRDAALRQAITRDAHVFSPEVIGHERRLLWLGFDADAYEIEAPALNTAAWGQADGSSTALLTAIEQALQRARGKPISGLVLFSDGRTPQGTGADLIRRLQQLAVGVFSVPLGAANAPPDLSLARVDAPEKAFINDTVPVTVWVEHYPVDASVDPRRVRVRLIDTATGQTIDESRADPAGLHRPIRLMGRSGTVGPAGWAVELIYDPDTGGGLLDAVTSVETELVTENNQRQLVVEMIDRPIRVLYIEGYPRWDYRYLKTILVREKSVDCSIMLTSADRGFAQEGDTPIARLPRDAQELRSYDVVIIGDVDADYFSPRQLQLLRGHVAGHGAGLMWIGGSDHTPVSYENTPLAELLPMRSLSRVRRVDPGAGALTVVPTVLAEALNVMRLGSGEEDPSGGDSGRSSWPSGLAPLTWVQDVGGLKPSAEVLAEATQGEQGPGMPVVLRMRYGAGQSLYVATDEIWRWRYGRGDLYLQRFWLQLIRMLGRHRIAQDTQSASLHVSNTRIELGQSVVVELQADEATLIDPDLPTVLVTVTKADDGSPDRSRTEAFSRIELIRVPDRRQAGSPADQQIDAAPSDPGAQDHVRTLYRAVWKPTAAGRLDLRVTEPSLDALDLTAGVDVIHPDDELRHPMPDHDRLRALSEQTSGRVVPLSRLHELPAMIPNRARRVPDDISEPLWNSPLALIVVVSLLTVEWVGRKVIRLT